MFNSRRYLSREITDLGKVVSRVPADRVPGGPGTLLREEIDIAVKTVALAILSPRTSLQLCRYQRDSYSLLQTRSLKAGILIVLLTM